MTKDTNKGVVVGYIDETGGYFDNLIEKTKRETKAETTMKIIKLFQDFEYEARLTPNDVIKLISENT